MGCDRRRLGRQRRRCRADAHPGRAPGAGARGGDAGARARRLRLVLHQRGEAALPAPGHSPPGHPEEPPHLLGDQSRLLRRRRGQPVHHAAREAVPVDPFPARGRPLARLGRGDAPLLGLRLQGRQPGRRRPRLAHRSRRPRPLLRRAGALPRGARVAGRAPADSRRGVPGGAPDDSCGADLQGAGGAGLRRPEGDHLPRPVRPETTGPRRGALPHLQPGNDAPRGRGDRPDDAADRGDRRSRPARRRREADHRGGIRRRRDRKDGGGTGKAGGALRLDAGERADPPPLHQRSAPPEASAPPAACSAGT